MIWGVYLYHGGPRISTHKGQDGKNILVDRIKEFIQDGEKT